MGFILNPVVTLSLQFVLYLMTASAFWYQGERPMALVWFAYTASLIGFGLQALQSTTRNH